MLHSTKKKHCRDGGAPPLELVGHVLGVQLLEGVVVVEEHDQAHVQLRGGISLIIGGFGGITTLFPIFPASVRCGIKPSFSQAEMIMGEAAVLPLTTYSLCICFVSSLWSSVSAGRQICSSHQQTGCNGVQTITYLCLSGSRCSYAEAQAKQEDTSAQAPMFQ